MNTFGADTDEDVTDWGQEHVEQKHRELLDAVAECLSNALENGHDFKGWTDEAIADDMIECGGMPDDTPRNDLVAAIKHLRT